MIGKRSMNLTGLSVLSGKSLSHTQALFAGWLSNYHPEAANEIIPACPIR
jgi:hypothetical protein